MSSSSLIRLAGLPALLLALIHRSAQKRNSANFALHEFSEVCMQDAAYPGPYAGRGMQRMTARRKTACARWEHYYLRSSSRTPNASASLRAVRGDAIWRSSSKSEIESAETPLLAESWRRVIWRSWRTLFRLCSSGMEVAYPFCACPERLTQRATRWAAYRAH